MSDPADQTPWYRDLVAGEGAAESLAPDLRAALAGVSRPRAAEQREHELERERQDVAEQRRVQAEVAANERAQLARRNGAIVGAAFRLLPVRLVVAAVLVGLTPVGASFATVLPDAAGDNIRGIVFFASETGSTTGDGPWTLYQLLFWLCVAALLCTFVIDLVFGPPRGASLPAGAVIGALAGVALFIVQWASGSLTAPSWGWAPGGVAAGYLIQALVSGARRTVAPGPGVTSRMLADR